MNTPFFSIAIATYNRANLLQTCIDSCLQQSFPDLEVIIVDGASTDGSVDVIRSICDQRVSLYVQPENKGISSGRYEAVMLARGEWILQVDSDHTLLPNALQLLKQAIDEIQMDTIGAVCARYRWSNGYVTPSFLPGGVVGYEDRIQWVEQEGGHDTLFCARRKALLETNWFMDRRASMDTLFHLNFSKRWRQIYIDYELALQFATTDNSSTRGHRGRARSLRKWAVDMAWQYEEIVRSHGATLSLYGPNTLRAVRRQASLQNFYAYNRRTGLIYGLSYLKSKPSDLKFWVIFIIGIIGPYFLPLMNECRHAVRNRFNL